VTYTFRNLTPGRSTFQFDCPTWDMLNSRDERGGVYWTHVIRTEAATNTAGAAMSDARVTTHQVMRGDARQLSGVADASVDLVVTSPPYWTLKQYAPHADQLGAIDDYEQFLVELDQVWRECFRALTPGGRMCIVVGDVCLSRRKHGRHRVIPLHADITTRCVQIGFDNLAPIFWYKIANIRTEMDRPGYFLGKPFEPNGIIKNDVEYILLLRKPGEYRHPSEIQREQSRIEKSVYHLWYRQIWDDVGGHSTREHPAPFPLEIADRLIRMFSFVDDTVLDPFLGTGTTTLAAMLAGRNSIGVEIDAGYLELARRRLCKHDRMSGMEIRESESAPDSWQFTAHPAKWATTAKVTSRGSLRGRTKTRKPKKAANPTELETMPIPWSETA
jgi:DNA modification methylase